MKSHYMKIQEKFIPEIISGNKKHEYRLATPERMTIKVGDALVLVSNQNEKNFVKVTVKAVKVYSGWKDALTENWQDFRDIYLTLDDALRDCREFYPKTEVDTYGIVAFEIQNPTTATL